MELSLQAPAVRETPANNGNKVAVPRSRRNSENSTRTMELSPPATPVVCKLNSTKHRQQQPAVKPTAKTTTGELQQQDSGNRDGSIPLALSQCLKSPSPQASSTHTGGVAAFKSPSQSPSIRSDCAGTQLQGRPAAATSAATPKLIQPHVQSPWGFKPAPQAAETAVVTDDGARNATRKKKKKKKATAMVPAAQDAPKGGQQQHPNVPRPTGDSDSSAVSESAVLAALTSKPITITTAEVPEWHSTRTPAALYTNNTDINNNENSSNNHHSRLYTSNGHYTPRRFSGSHCGRPLRPRNGVPAVAASGYYYALPPRFFDPPWMMNAATPITLHEEIKLFEKYFDPVAEETWMRNEVVKRVSAFITGVFPNAEVELYGSCVSNLFLPSSDVDMVVHLGASSNNTNTKNSSGCGDDRPRRDTQVLALCTLADAVRQSGVYHLVAVLPNARVPLLKLRDAYSWWVVDVCFNRRAGPANTLMVRRLASRCPCLRPLVLLLKHFLRLRHANDPYFGGIGSYALVLMVASLLQRQGLLGDIYADDAEDKGSDNGGDGRGGIDLGFQLMYFFLLYGIKFDYFHTGISLQGAGSYFQKAERGWVDATESFLLCIEDPNDHNNDVGRSSYDILNVRTTFAQAYFALLQATGGGGDGVVDPVGGDGVTKGRFSAGTEPPAWLHANSLWPAQQSVLGRIFRPDAETDALRGWVCNCAAVLKRGDAVREEKAAAANKEEQKE
eukprot:TRINITY_DN1205_c0_g1_i1.p1 TRINITY_DN1205_c0_g1~~TRINITY_DN1205_c0_g1_i1.p1  ORF type:complete len:729 (-),score=175.69 TRINITY_DN1205_c0_g1_i1:1013-3199(-)